ncbi:MAG: acetate--CoA ligase family protein, partial [Gaiellaceae bacterium]
LMNHPEMVRISAEALLRDGDVGAVVVFVGVGGETAERVVDALLAVDVPEGQVITVVWIGASEAVRQRLGAGGIPLFGDIGPCIRALARLWQRGSVSGSSPPTVAAEPRALLLEHELKPALAKLGLPVPAGHAVPAGAAETPALDPTSRYAVKGQARGVAHKAAHGLVKLDCGSDAVPAACAAIVAAAAAHDVVLECLLIEEMAEPGIELLVTLRDDATFGWVILVGAGGSAVELLRDVVARPCPLTEADATAALESLAAAELFENRADARANVCRLLVEVSAAGERLPAGVAELELNPVIVTAERAMIVDAVAFLQPQ